VRWGHELTVPEFVAGLVLGSRMEEWGGQGASLPVRAGSKSCTHPYHLIPDSTGKHDAWTQPDARESENVPGGPVTNKISGL